jgi:GNAT superfamily N-acetyltransferase
MLAAAQLRILPNWNISILHPTIEPFTLFDDKDVDSKMSKSQENIVVSIFPARASEQISAARELFTTYAGTLKIDLTFQDFQPELDSLPGVYAPPIGEIFLAYLASIDNISTPIGCIAVRPLKLSEGRYSNEICEVKRLYVAPLGRGQGIGHQLVTNAIDFARKLGYTEMKLDTLLSMQAARKLYATFGFVECEKYYDTPIEGTIFMSKIL